MKKIIAILLFIPVISFAQHPIPLGPLTSPIQNNEDFERQNTSLYVNYSQLSGDNYSFAWHNNAYYNSNDTAINFVGLAIDQIAGCTNWSNLAGSTVTHLDLGLSSSYPSNLNINIDSLIVYLLHENNSGQNDTLITELRVLNSDNTISSTVIWSDTKITNTGWSPNNNVSGGIAGLTSFRIPVNYAPPAGQKCGVVLRYLNYNKQDTFAVPGAFLQAIGNPFQAQQAIYKNSFMSLPPYTPGIIRTSDYQYPSGNYFPAQNWYILPVITVQNTSLGMNDLQSSSIAVSPNPSNKGDFFITLKDNEKIVSYTLSDLTGRTIASELHPVNSGLNLKTNEKGIFILRLETLSGSKQVKICSID